MITDLTQGKPLKQILLFAIPTALASIAQMLYHIGDMFIVGRCLGPDAIGAIGSCGAPFYMILLFFTGLISGMMVITTQRFGATDYGNMRRSITICLVISTVVSGIGGGVMCILCKPMLRMMNTPVELFDYCYVYMSIIFGGMLITSLANVAYGILRALGDSRTPLIFSLISATINFFLNILFIMVFKWGVAGAAIATITVQLLSALMCFYVISRHDILRLKRADWHLKYRFTFAHLNMGLPVAFQSSIIGIGLVILQRVMNGFGPTAVTGVTMGGNVEQFSGILLGAFSTAILTYTGQNFGAKKYDRIEQGIRQTFIFLVCFVSVMWFVCQLIYPYVVRFFVGAEAATPELLDYTRTFLLIHPTFYAALAVIMVYRYALQGMGFTKIALAAAVAELLARIVISMLFAKYFGFKGACFADPGAWIAADVILLPYYIYHIRRLKRKQFQTAGTSVSSDAMRQA